MASLAAQKELIRSEALKRRRSLPARDALSQDICREVLELAEYRSAVTVIVYMGVRSEVQTTPLIEEALADGKRVAVPYCAGEQLALFHLRSLAELVPGEYRIPEPLAELRTSARAVALADVDLVVVPGVAFDRRGARLGFGRGYFDRLLSQLPRPAPRVGLAFGCQLFEVIPTEAHDEPLDAIVTEHGAIWTGARAGSPCRMPDP